LGLPGKQEVAGKDVQALYAEGALDRIAAYCMTDVVQTWLLFLRFRLLEGSLSPDGYLEAARSAREDLPGLFGRLTTGEREVLAGYLERCAGFFGAERSVRPARAG
jgi:hypothetical protein